MTVPSMIYLANYYATVSSNCQNGIDFTGRVQCVIYLQFIRNPVQYRAVAIIPRERKRDRHNVYENNGDL